MVAQREVGNKISQTNEHRKSLKKNKGWKMKCGEEKIRKKMKKK